MDGRITIPMPAGWSEQQARAFSDKTGARIAWSEAKPAEGTPVIRGPYDPVRPGERDILQSILYAVRGWSGGQVRQLLGFFRSYAYRAAMHNANSFVAAPLRLFRRVPAGERPTNASWRELTREERMRSRRERKRNGARMVPAFGRDGNLIGGGDGGEVIEVLDHPLIEMFRKPDADQDAGELLTKLSLYLDIAGDAYLYVRRDLIGNPQGLMLLPSQNVWPWVDPDAPDAPIEYFRVGVGGQLIVPKADIVQIKEPNPGGLDYVDYSGLTRGYSPFAAALDALTNSELMSEFDRDWLSRKGTPRFAVVTDEAVADPEKRQRFHDEITAFLYDPLKSGSPMILDKCRIEKLDEDTSGRGVAASGGAQRESLVATIYTQLGVPPVWGSSGQSVAGGNAEQSRYWHIEQTVNPRRRRVEERLNRTIVPMFGDTELFLAFDDPLPFDRDGQTEESVGVYVNGGTTLNEFRDELGLPPLPGGDVTKDQQTAANSLAMAQAAAAASPQEPMAAQFAAQVASLREEIAAVRREGGKTRKALALLLDGDDAPAAAANGGHKLNGRLNGAAH